MCLVVFLPFLGNKLTPPPNHAPFPMGGREGRASALQMPDILWAQYGGRLICTG
ncbi:MAG: hypothetical protein ACJAVM_003203 [Sulfitobacter sp.]|jgi:hypothetical protein